VAAAFDDPYEDVVEAKERFDLKRWEIGTAIRRGSIRDCGWMTGKREVIPGVRLADDPPRIAGFAEHQGSTKLTPRGHPINATESERKTFEACSNPCSRTSPQRWSSSLIAWRRLEFSEHMAGGLHDGRCPNPGKASQNRAMRGIRQPGVLE
jgi:hypothetical protein